VCQGPFNADGGGGGREKERKRSHFARAAERKKNGGVFLPSIQKRKKKGVRRSHSIPPVLLFMSFLKGRRAGLIAKVSTSIAATRQEGKRGEENCVLG